MSRLVPPPSVLLARALTQTLAVALLVLCACQGVTLLPGESPAPAPAADEGPGVEPFDVPALRADVRIEPGPYATDLRFVDLATDWGERVDRAIERMAVVAGLAFDDGAEPRVILGSLGDERVPYELQAEVRDGRRRVRLFVNAEPLLGKVRRPDRVLLRALGAAAFEDAARRHGAVPRWLVALAGTAVAGDLSDRLVALRKRAHEGDPDVLRVDPDDATAAEATSLAALLLLTTRGEPDDVRRLLRFVVDGDDASAVLGRITRQPAGGWAPEARLLLRGRLSALSGEPWRRLREAEEAFMEAGRAGLETALEDGAPPQIAAEVLVLRARAAAAEGDHAKARDLLRRLDDDAPARLRDPAAALALRIRVESRRGGDARLARRLALHLDRDFPRSGARAELRRAHPLLGMEEDPQRWMVLTRARIEQDGTDALDLATIERYVRTLLQDHRAGAAQRLLGGLGERSRAPELTGIAMAVGDARVEPSEAALQRNAERVAAWRLRPEEEQIQAVRDGGCASAPALAALLAAPAGVSRRDVIVLLAQSAGVEVAIEHLVAEWKSGRGNVTADVDHLLAEANYLEVRAALSDDALLESGMRQSSRRFWGSQRYGMDPSWIEAHPRFLVDMRSPDYAVRRAAFDLVAGGDPRAATPQLVGLGLRDPAALLRRQAVRTAGRAGFAALGRRGLEDRSWLVREEACRVVATLEGAAAVDALIARLRDEEVVAVRRAAAAALMRVTPRHPGALRALVNTQLDEDNQLRDGVAAGLAELEVLPVARAIEGVWSVASRRARPHRGFLFRTALLFQRVTGLDVSYTPESKQPELRQVWARMRRWVVARESRDSRSAAQGAGPRVPGER